MDSLDAMFQKLKALEEALEARFSSTIDSGEGEREPSWVSGRRENQANCVFYRLPEELVLPIMEHLDDVSKHMAMRTCGLLLRITFDKKLYSPDLRAHGTWMRNNCSSEIKIWPPFEKLERHYEREQMDRLLDRDRFCAPCRQFRDDGRHRNALRALYRRIWCSFCAVTHQRVFFSAHERKKTATQDGSRECVLAQGRVRVCAHLSIRIDHTGKKLYYEGNRQHKWWRKTEIGQTLPEGLRITCQHPEHLLAARHQQEIESPSDQYQMPYMHMWKEAQPTKQLWEFGTTVFIADITGAPHETRAWLEKQLVEKAETLDKETCPHVTAPDGQLMLPFGVGHCACFGFHGWPKHEAKRHETNPRDPLSGGWDGLCCRCKTARKEPLSGSRSAEHNYKILASESEPGSQSHHQYRCPICDCHYRWLRLGSGLFLQVKRKIDRRYRRYFPSKQLGPREHNWLHNIDPASFGILQDEELRHVAWCDDINCMTRWRWVKLFKLWDDGWEIHTHRTRNCFR